MGTEKRQASGKIELDYKSTESVSGRGPEDTYCTELVGDGGNVTMICSEYHADGYKPVSKSEHKYSISVADLIQLIKENGSQV
ncbi:hypothetical protein [Vibrio coralliilyticus]|uniref:hypothetical protein n=1 Tax=Vibrio coralliilyticus TaxID=190893 RepID=UPI00115C8055|nr:hypothetical protein [Vibrio coralliilyticus]